jgi:xanthine dehydrogenase accessory factor
MDASQAWIERLSELRAAGRPCAMVVVGGLRGSGPREPGARMIVVEDDFWGTIGGGNLERQALAHARELLAAGEACAESVAYPLGPAVGQCCGGEVTLLYEVFPWRRRRVFVFGAGHVGQALGALARHLSADVTLIDSREEGELRPVPPPRAERPWELVCVDAPEEEVDGLPAGAAVLVMTHDHGLDLEIVARALERDDFAYLGLIGSERKRARFEKRLAARGVPPERLVAMRCPIGVVRGSKEPGAIALSAALEVLESLAAAPAGAREPRA